jgi:hypothetical protein
MSSAAMQ